MSTTISLWKLNKVCIHTTTLHWEDRIEWFIRVMVMSIMNGESSEKFKVQTEKQ